MIWKNKGEWYSHVRNPDTNYLTCGRYAEHEIDQKVEQLREQLLSAAEVEENEKEM